MKSGGGGGGGRVESLGRGRSACSTRRAFIVPLEKDMKLSRLKVPGFPRPSKRWNVKERQRLVLKYKD